MHISKIDPCPLPDGRVLHIVRDDIIPGGTKQIVLQRWLPRQKATHFVYTASAFGKGGAALAYACAALGLQVTLVIADGPHTAPWLDDVEKAGATIVRKPPMPVHLLEQFAKSYADKHDAFYVPLGFADDAFIADMAAYAQTLVSDMTLSGMPTEIWCPVISGTMLRALERAFPDVPLRGVAVVKHHDYKGAATLYQAQEKFVRGAAVPPPYPSWAYSDAKVWRFAKKHGRDGAFIWNSNA